MAHSNVISESTWERTMSVEFQIAICLSKMCPSWKRNSRNHHASASKCNYILMFGRHPRVRLPVELSTRTDDASRPFRGYASLENIRRIAGKFSENCATLLRVGCEQSLFLSLVDLVSQRAGEIYFFPLNRASHSLTSACSRSLTRSTRTGLKNR